MVHRVLLMILSLMILNLMILNLVFIPAMPRIQVPAKVEI